MIKVDNFIVGNGVHTFVNPYSYVLLERSLSSSELAKFRIHADGIAVVWLERLFGNTIKRYSFDFTSIADEVFSDCSAKNKSIAFVGSTSFNIAKFEEVIREIYPNLNISYIRDGYIQSNEDWIQSVKSAINCDVVVVGMGTPNQEKFLLSLIDSGWLGAGYTCGGFFDQTALAGQCYYPDWINQYNLRWLYRIYKEPTRLWKRYFIDYPYFLFYYLRAKMK